MEYVDNFAFSQNRGAQRVEAGCSLPCHFPCSEYNKLRANGQLLCRYFWIKIGCRKGSDPRHLKFTHFKLVMICQCLLVYCQVEEKWASFGQGIFETSLYLFNSLDENGTILKNAKSKLRKPHLPLGSHLPRGNCRGDFSCSLP